MPNYTKLFVKQNMVQSTKTKDTYGNFDGTIHKMNFGASYLETYELAHGSISSDDEETLLTVCETAREVHNENGVSFHVSYQIAHSVTDNYSIPLAVKLMAES